MKTRWLPFSLGLLLVAATGAAHGIWSNRWYESHDLEEAAARVQSVPLSVGEWTATESKLEARVVQLADLTGYVNRPYENRVTGGTVNVLLVCGKPGPISVHTPEVCYGGAGYRIVEGPTKYSVPGVGEFWTARVRRQDAAATVNLRVMWGWSAGGAWQAPDNPRLVFGRYRFLYKLYVVRETSAEETLSKSDPTVAFLSEVVPELQKTLCVKRP